MQETRVRLAQPGGKNTMQDVGRFTQLFRERKSRTRNNSAEEGAWESSCATPYRKRGERGRTTTTDPPPANPRPMRIRARKSGLKAYTDRARLNSPAERPR